MFAQTRLHDVAELLGRGEHLPTTTFFAERGRAITDALEAAGHAQQALDLRSEPDSFMEALEQCLVAASLEREIRACFTAIRSYRRDADTFAASVVLAEMLRKPPRTTFSELCGWS
jgi:hypothetical protein